MERPLVGVAVVVLVAQAAAEAKAAMALSPEGAEGVEAVRKPLPAFHRAREAMVRRG